MATTKKAAKAPVEKTLLEKIGEQAVHLKEEIIAGKDLLVEAAGEKIAAVKQTIAKYKASKKAAAKKPLKKTVKKAAKKIAKKATVQVKKAAVAVKKKVSPSKKAAKKPAAKKGLPVRNRAGIIISFPPKKTGIAKAAAPAKAKKKS